MKFTVLKLSVLLALSMASAAHAATIVSEDFNYTAGQSLNGLNGGTGWGGAWNGSTTPAVTSPSLDFPGLTENGNKATLGFDGSTYTIFRPLSSAIDGTTTSQLNLSFLFNLTGNDADTDIRFAGLSLFSGTGTELFFFGKPGNTTDIGIEKYAGGHEVDGVDTTYSASTVFLFQAQFTLSSTGDSTVTVSVSDNSSGGTLLDTWSDLSLGLNFSFDNIRLIRDVSLDSGIDAQVDEIRVSTVPEPTTWALFGVAVAAWIGPRFRRKYFVKQQMSPV